MTRFESNPNPNLYMLWFNCALAFHSDVIANDHEIQHRARNIITELEEQVEARNALLRLQGKVELLSYQSGSVEQMKAQIIDDEVASGESTEVSESDEGDFDFDDA